MKRELIISVIATVLVFALAPLTQAVDSDGDGIDNPNDNCWAIVNPDQTDSDSDCPARPFAEDPLCGNACDDFCLYELIGDINYDCKIDLVDFALMCKRWLVDCGSNPGDPECIQVDYDSDGWSSTVDCDDQNPDVYPGAVEACDGLDNNCDGSIDEGLTGAPCVMQSGVCAGSTEQCYGSAGWRICDSVTYYIYSTDYEAVEFTCDDLDNDCDGSVDESLIGDLCPLQDGVCAGYRQECISGAWQPCEYGPDYEAVEATCDGLDNDCDGFIDEGLTGAPCAMQSGVCAGSTKQCCGSAGWCICDSATYYIYSADYEAVEFTCDGLDNDCDGSVDEGLVGDLCPLQEGVCAGYRQECINGAWQPCEYGPDYEAVETTCDGLDNDCDGVIDEGC